MNQLNCRQIFNAIKIIKSQKNLFEIELQKNNVQVCVELKSEIVKKIEQIKFEYWPLEILTPENIEKQYDSWKETYDNLNLGIELPSKEKVFEFLKRDFQFKSLMKTKEKQGLTKLIIAPSPGSIPLVSFADKIGQKVEENGGRSNYNSDLWLKMLESDEDICYFGKVKDGNSAEPVSGGATSVEIKQDPDRFSICDGWIISFTTESATQGNQNRPPIQADQSPHQYQKLYFSDEDKCYKGEEPIVPQEFFALTAQDIYENFSKIGKKLVNLPMDFSYATLFISTYLPGNEPLPIAHLDRYRGKLICKESGFLQTGLTVRSAVRRNLKS